MSDNVKFCSNCGSALPSEEKVAAPVDFDPDATIIVDRPAQVFNPNTRVVPEVPVAPVQPVAPVYQAPVAEQPVAPVNPVTPVYPQTPPATPAYSQPAYVPPVAPVNVNPVANQKKPVNVKLIAIIGGAVALIAGIIILIVCLAGNNSGGGGGGGGSDDPDTPSSSVSSDVKEYINEYLDYLEISNYKSAYKIDGPEDSYYQIVTADWEEDGEYEGYLIAELGVVDGEIFGFIYETFDDDEKDLFEEYKDEVIDYAKEEKEDIIEDLEQLVDEDY